ENHVQLRVIEDGYEYGKGQKQYTQGVQKHAQDKIDDGYEKNDGIRGYSGVLHDFGQKLGQPAEAHESGQQYGANYYEEDGSGTRQRIPQSVFQFSPCHLLAYEGQKKRQCRAERPCLRRRYDADV